MSPKAPAEPPGWKRHVNLQNALLVLVTLFNAGTYWERQQHTNARVAEELASVRVDLATLRQERETVYVRKDIFQLQLAALEGRLAVLEGLVRHR